MKKILLSLFIIMSFYSNAQEYKIEEKSVTAIFEVPGKSKSEIFSSINKWISINYNSGKTVTQLSDPEGGNIIIKGINEVVYQNSAKILYPNNSSIPELTTLRFNHTIEINVKDNKYRVIYKLVDIYYEPSEKAYLTSEMVIMGWKSINLIGITDSTLVELSDFNDKILKKGLIGKEKREKYIQNLKPMYDKINTSIIDDIKNTMLLINKSIKTDGW